MFNITRSTTPVLAALAASAALAGSAHAATPTFCTTSLPGPGGTSWQLAKDGSLADAVKLGAGRAFETGTGALKVNGGSYVGSDGLACSREGNAISYPTKLVNNLLVTRQVSVTAGGRLRMLDLITNTTPDFVFTTGSVDVTVDEDQRSVDSNAAGTGELTHKDRWGVLDDDFGKAFGFLQWGDAPGVSEAAPWVYVDGVDGWKPVDNKMPEKATLAYDNLQIPKGKTIRLLHVLGVAATKAEASGQAADFKGSWAGFGFADAQNVANWTPDVDGDGVMRSADQCPATPGPGTADGCPALPQPPQPADGDGGTDPAPAPNPGDPQPAPQPEPQPAPQPQPPARDLTAPTVKLTGLPTKQVKRATLKALRFRVSCSETCTVRAQLKLRKKGVKHDVAVHTVTSATGKVTLRASSKLLKRLARQRATVVIVATDAAGNRTTVQRQLKIKG